MVLVAGCTTAHGSTTEPAIVDQAAAEATAIIQRAKATAMVLQAQAQATVLIQNSNAPASTLTQVPSTPQGANPTQQTVTSATQTVEESEVELLGVSLGTETGLILVQFKASPAQARRWQQGDVCVINEATGDVYDEIPVAPVIGPLFGRPNQANQIGYVMFVNLPVPLQSGTQVTVKLGDYIFEHVLVK